MKPAPFRYARADSLADAIALLAAAPGDTKLLAGGQSLVPMLNMRLVRPAVLVDVNGLRELTGITPTANGGLRIGALTRHAELAASSAGDRPGAAPGRGRAPRGPRGDPEPGHARRQPRARRSRGGAARGAAGPRRARPDHGPARRAGLAANAFFRGLLTTALEADEILTAIEVPAEPPGWGFVEIARRPGDFALAGVAAGVGVGGPSPCPLPLAGEREKRGGARGAPGGLRRRGSAAPAPQRGARLAGEPIDAATGARAGRRRAPLRSAERRSRLRRLSSAPGHGAHRAGAAPGGRPSRGIPDDDAE